MSAADELASLEELIQNINTEDIAINQKEIDLNLQIATLRHEIAKLKDSRHRIRQQRREVELNKESLARKLELEEEANRIQQAISQREAEALDLIKDANWFDPEYRDGYAFRWQVQGAIQLPDRALLGDKRGLGKTLSSLIWRRVHGVKKTLICVRTQVAQDFMKELAIREPKLFVYPMIGVTPEQRNIAAFLLNTHEEFVVITNIESWRRNIEKTTEDILKIDYDGVILDEAHHIKNFATGTAQGFMRLAERIPKVLEMTGTPIKNKPQEMFTLLHALYPLLFPDEKMYLRDYCVSAGQNKWIFSQHGLVQLVKKISAFYLARSPEDVGKKIPPPRIVEYNLNFDNHEQQRDAYKIMTERSMAILGSGAVIPIVSQLAIMTRQAQVVSWPAGIEFKIKDEEGNVLEVVKFDVHQSVKMDWAEELIQELVEEGERAVLFSRFVPAIYELKKRLEIAGLSVAVITGNEKNNTKEIFNDFDLKTAPEKPKYDVLLATYQTVGESANFNSARHMVLYDRFWNPGNEDQAIGRIDRINSTHQATIHVPTVSNSIDEYMNMLIEEKRDIVSGFKTAAGMQQKLIEHLSKTLKE